MSNRVILPSAWASSFLQQFSFYLTETPSGVDHDQALLEELLGKVKSTPTASTKSNVHQFKTPDSSFTTNLTSNGASQCKSSPTQNPFRKSTGIKRPAAKQVNYWVLI